MLLPSLGRVTTFQQMGRLSVQGGQSKSSGGGTDNCDFLSVVK